MLLRLPPDVMVAILRHVHAMGLAHLASTCQVLCYGKHNESYKLFGSAVSKALLAFRVSCRHGRCT